MAAVLLRKRDSCAAKLEDSIRQLNHYLDAGRFSQSIIQQKCDADILELSKTSHIWG